MDKKERDKMKNKLKKLLVIMCILAIQSNMLGRCDQVIKNDQGIKPDLVIQDQFKHIVSEEDKEKSISDISTLKEAENRNLGHLIQQLIYFRVNIKQMYDMKKISYNEMETSMNGSLHIFNNFLTVKQGSNKIDSAAVGQIVSAVVPYLGTEDQDTKKQLRWLLKGIDFQELSSGNYGLYKADYTEYELFIKDKKDAPPQSLIQYMYEISPGDALLALTRIYINESKIQDAITQSEKLIKDDSQKRYFSPVEKRKTVGAEARQAVDDLSKNDQWWVRLYVAEIIGREPALRSPEILDRLKKDTNPLVHDTLKRFQIEQEQ